jgi:hypothetical protein
MARAKLYLDEDITDLLARVLRSAGDDVVSAHEVGMRGKSDDEQLKYAIAEGRAILSFNVAHFPTLARWAFDNQIEHFGIVVSTQLDFKNLLHRVQALLDNVTAEDLRNNFIWLP